MNVRRYKFSIGCVIVVGVSAFTSSGCSLLFVKPPLAGAEDSAPDPEMECTSSKVAPIFDTVFTGTNLLSAAVAATADDKAGTTSSQPVSREASVALGLGFGALFLGSAIYGFATTSRCDRIHHGSAGAPGAAPAGSSRPRSPAAPSHTSDEYSRRAVDQRETGSLTFGGGPAPLVVNAPPLRSPPSAAQF